MRCMPTGAWSQSSDTFKAARLATCVSVTNHDNCLWLQYTVGMLSIAVQSWQRQCRRSVVGYIEIRGSVYRMHWHCHCRGQDTVMTVSQPQANPAAKMPAAVTLSVTAAMHPRMNLFVLGGIASVTFLNSIFYDGWQEGCRCDKINLVGLTSCRNKSC